MKTFPERIEPLQYVMHRVATSALPRKNASVSHAENAPHRPCFSCLVITSSTLKALASPRLPPPFLSWNPRRPAPFRSCAIRLDCRGFCRFVCYNMVRWLVTLPTSRLGQPFPAIALCTPLPCTLFQSDGRNGILLVGSRREDQPTIQ